MPNPATGPLRPGRVVATELEQLAELLGAQRVPPTESGARIVVTGVSLSTDAVRDGDVFAAVAGAHGHGIAYASDAVARGARTVLTDSAGLASAPTDVPVLVVDDPRADAALAAAHIYGRPSAALDVVGITGTSGKTTTSYLLRAALIAGGRRSGLIGTVGAFIDDTALPAKLTTPEAPDLQALLAVMAQSGQDSVVMEVSSHALSLQRVAQVSFSLAGFTNLSQDHLDFHADLEDYFQAKARLFDGRAARHVVVVDDEWGARLAATLAGNVVTVGTNQVTPADWSVADVAIAPDGGTRFDLIGPGTRVSTGCAIPGAYNVANAVLALAIAVELGVPAEVAAPAIAAAQVPGRMERIDAGQNFLAVVDYSHKPAAVEGALRALRPLTAGRLIIVLGCGGDRDRGKRPLMGRVAATAADVLIVTDDNPRTESAPAIRAQMLAGAAQVPPAQRATVLEVGDRGEAISQAIDLAVSGDTVLVAGKGHETGQEVAGVITSFDDRVVVRAALARRQA